MSTPPRKPLHTRRITYEGFLREDGLFEMEAELVDTKGEVLHLVERGAVDARIDAVDGCRCGHAVSPGSEYLRTP